jgi:hypothetical protein
MFFLSAGGGNAAPVAIADRRFGAGPTTRTVHGHHKRAGGSQPAVSRGATAKDTYPARTSSTNSWPRGPGKRRRSLNPAEAHSRSDRVLKAATATRYC